MLQTRWQRQIRHICSITLQLFCQTVFSQFIVKLTRVKLKLFSIIYFLVCFRKTLLTKPLFTTNTIKQLLQTAAVVIKREEKRAVSKAGLTFKDNLSLIRLKFRW